MRHRLVLTTLAAALALGGTASARSPSPTSTAPTASPASTPFPWATLPPPADDPALPRFVPVGPPDARNEREGVITELWLSSPSVDHGAWTQAHVRITNTRDDAIWGPGGCVLPTRVRVDLSGAVPPGETWDGNAAAFKRRVIRERGLLGASFRAESRGTHSTAWVTATASALLDCGGTGGDVDRLGPGRVLDVTYAWYPMQTFDAYDQWVRPLPPGIVTVTASYDLIDHGRRPTDNSRTRPISASTSLELTGEIPTFPSYPELIDAALRDSTFAAWVGQDPTRTTWAGTYAGGWPGPGYPPQPRYTGLAGRAPNGILEFWLVRDLPGHIDTIGSVILDPWTGEVLAVAFQCGDDACPLSLPGVPSDSHASPSPSASPSVVP